MEQNRKPRDRSTWVFIAQHEPPLKEYLVTSMRCARQVPHIWFILHTCQARCLLISQVKEQSSERWHNLPWTTQLVSNTDKSGIQIWLTPNSRHLLFTVTLSCPLQAEARASRHATEMISEATGCSTTTFKMGKREKHWKCLDVFPIFLNR